MSLPSEPYLEQLSKWSKSGRHILAHFDEQTIVVYQAYSPAIGDFAVRHGCFGAGFSYNRMSWIKPNFLWMMYRSDWGRSFSQEVVLAVRIQRRFFDLLLERAVPSSFDAILFASPNEWTSAVEQSDIRLQWDPDHRPDGAKEERRAVQVGLRGDSLAAYGKQEIIEIIDMSAFVAPQRESAVSGRQGQLPTPIERVYLPQDPEIVRRIGLSVD